MPRIQTNYVFLTGSIRAIEARGLSKETLARLIESTSVEDAFGQLKNTFYGEYLKDLNHTHDIHGLLSKRRDDLYKLVHRNSEHPALSLLLSISFDYHNLKTCLKDRIHGSDSPDLLVSWGSIPIPVLREIFHDESYGKLPGPMGRSIERAIERYFTLKKTAVIDAVLDRAMHTHALDLCRELESSILNESWKLRIDLVNALSLFRKNRFPEDLFTEYLIPGGELDPFEYLGSSSKTMGLAGYLDRRNEFKNLVRVMESGNDNALSFEREADNALSAFFEPYRFLPWGLEAVYIHAYAVELELKILGFVLSAIGRGIHRTVLLERLPSLFGGSS
jgi:V/A-type H+-transporting ATPase subunit C